MRRAAFLLLAVCAATSLAIAAEPKPASIPLERVLGTWRGFSICAGERGACKDERVRFHVTRLTSGPWPVVVTAEKLVGASWDTMGVTEMNYDAGRGELSRDFEIGTTHGLLRFRLAGDALDRLEGTLVTLPDSTLGRVIEASRDTSRGVPVREPDSVFAPVEWLVGGTWRLEMNAGESKSLVASYAWRNDRVAIHFDRDGRQGFYAYDPVSSRLVEWSWVDPRNLLRHSIERADSSGISIRSGGSVLRRTGPDSFVYEVGDKERITIGPFVRTRP